jgi:hypothetical protein
VARHILDHNPQTGETTYFDYSDERVVITHTQDVTPILKMAHYWTNKESKTDYGIKNDMWHYARVPNIIILEMKTKHGVDFFDKNDKPRVFHLLNTEYARFKTTHKRHSIKHA